MSTRDIIVHLSTNVFAGSDTTAIALRAIIWSLCHHPDKYDKFVKQIDEADKAGKLSEPVSFREANDHLPYLEAVMKEAMRLHPSVGLLMERHVPAGGVDLCGRHIPAGTIGENLQNGMQDMWLTSYLQSVSMDGSSNEIRIFSRTPEPSFQNAGSRAPKRS